MHDHSQIFLEQLIEKKLVYLTTLNSLVAGEIRKVKKMLKNMFFFVFDKH